LNKNSKFELFVFDGKINISDKMKNEDYRFPPDNIIVQGPESIRKFWNMKNLRKRDFKN